MPCSAKFEEQNSIESRTKYIEEMLDKELSIQPVFISSKEIGKVMVQLKKNKNSLENCSTFRDYKKFLSTFGAMYYHNVCIDGPLKASTEKEKIKYLKAHQQEFETVGKICNITEHVLKSCWYIGYNNENDEYYIDASITGRGFIYCKKYYGPIQVFALDFLEFIDNIYLDYKKENNI